MKELRVEKLDKKSRNVYGLILNNEVIGEVEVALEKKAFCIFNMEILKEYRKEGYGEFFTNWLIDNVAKPKGYHEVILQWILPDLIGPMKKRGYREMDAEDYNRVGLFIGESNIGKEINLIKEI